MHESIYRRQKKVMKVLEQSVRRRLNQRWSYSTRKMPGATSSREKEEGIVQETWKKHAVLNIRALIFTMWNEFLSPKPYCDICYIETNSGYRTPFRSAFHLQRPEMFLFLLCTAFLYISRTLLLS